MKYNPVTFASNLVRIGDIVNSEGPLLSLFQDVSNDRFYLFDWVDSGANSNRWLIFSVSAQSIDDFVHKKITYANLFSQAINHKYFYADLLNNQTVSNLIVNELVELPSKYFPDEGNFFSKETCPNYSKIVNAISNDRLGVYQINPMKYLLNTNLRSKFEDRNIPDELIKTSPSSSPYSREDKVKWRHHALREISKRKTQFTLK